MKQRLCNVFNCKGVMRPTRNFWPTNVNHRIYQCIICNNKQPWLDKPILTGSHAELHCIKFGEYSGLSMLSDPNIYPPKLIRKSRHVS